ncbi:helix-turn-helix domain-containing protein [Streptomyces sioyaensis]|uniref:helix-turn-helix domain-containing protein n=1 Tax=Streptomyces sioyaensis TaxID=67364 RepID=UPI00378F89F1
MGAAEEAAGVAALLKEWKDRSGYSYGVLAKRLHMSTSTLHRYCNGDAVPTEYAPLERLARLCRATPDELVELHRRWILADEARRRERDRKQGGGAAAVAGAGGERGAESGAVTAPGAGSEPVTTPGTDSAPAPEPEPECGAGAKSEPEDESEAGAGIRTVPPTAPVAAPAPAASASASPALPISASDSGQDAEPAPEGRSVPQVTPAGGRRRIALAAGIAAAAVAASAALVAGLASSDGGDGRKAAAGAATTTKSGSKPTKTGGGRSASAKPPAAGSARPSPSSSRTPGGKASGGAGDRATSPGTADRAGLPVSADVRPYSWEDPCSQRYLVDRDPGEMPPPPAEQEARGWISALGAVSADSQLVQVSVQGAGDETVVLHALRVRVVGSSAPPAWNAYSMGVGCGGGITPKSFGVSLDASQPRISPQNGQRDFPYKVSERDPEVFKVIARAGARDVRWYMELEWSSGNRHGTLRIDDNGEPFHTSGMAGHPQYDYPLGGSKWIPGPKENG